MPSHRIIEMTAIAVIAGQLPVRLYQSGFRQMQTVDATGCDQHCYVLPPVCVVPAGPYHRNHDPLQTQLACRGDLSHADRVVPAFQIATYPVTVAEYACAVEARCVPAPRTAGRLTWQRQQQHPDHPVRCLSWHEANAYAHWIAQMTDEDWRLPTEVEWEKAAWGITSPWGDQADVSHEAAANTRCGDITPGGNTRSIDDAHSSPVLSLISNLAEWTSSHRCRTCEAVARQRGVHDDVKRMVLCGSAWHDKVTSGYVEIMHHLGTASDFVSEGIGMRLAMSMHGQIAR